MSMMYIRKSRRIEYVMRIPIADPYGNNSKSRAKSIQSLFVTLAQGPKVNEVAFTEEFIVSNHAVLVIGITRQQKRKINIPIVIIFLMTSQDNTTDNNET